MSGSKIRQMVLGSKALPRVTYNVKLPGGLTDEIPDKAWVWLWQYGITEEEVARYRIQWSESLCRLIFPVYRKGKLVYWQGREFGLLKDLPKWVNQKAASREDIYFTAMGAVSTPAVVLVEDMVSAIKVNRIQNTIALLGSYVPDKLISNLSKHYKRIIIWLDADKDTYSLRRLSRYQSLGFPVQRVFTQQDPKAYSDDKIIRVLKGEALEEPCN